MSRRALLLAGGEGTRLRPLTNQIPKCLVPVVGRPLLGLWLEMLARSGFTEILVNTHYLSAQVEAFVKKSPWKHLVHLVYEPELLGTFGTLKAQINFLSDSTFLVAHADNLSLFSMDDFWRTHHNRPQESVMTMMTFFPEDPRTCGVVKLDESGIIIEFVEKSQNPPSNLANGAVFICDPKVFQWVESIQERRGEISIELLPQLVGRMSTFHNNVYHRDIGTIQSLEKANQDISTVLRAFAANHALQT